MIPVQWYFILSAVLFAIGVAGVLLRSNAIIIFMSIELMLNAANLLFVALAQHFQKVDGQVIVLFVLAIAAAEVAVGLSIIVTVFDNRQTIDVDEVSSMRW